MYMARPDPVPGPHEYPCCPGSGDMGWARKPSRRRSVGCDQVALASIATTDAI